ncbi:MAG: hypothetical protein WAM60_15920 [Candidatus Promineifilaceae bacterium]
MSVTVGSISPAAPLISKGKWIYTPRWDLAFISLSVFLIPVPYLTWYIMNRVFQINDSDARQAINLLVFAIIAGPHTYATFTRTALDVNFREKYSGFVRSSIFIPLVVIVLALANLTLLLTIFFFWASLHTFHQLSFIVGAYEQKEGAVAPRPSPSLLSRVLDYGVVVTALYPIAAYRIAVSKDFSIGPNNLNDIIPDVFEHPWLFYVAATLFGTIFIGFIIKSLIEINRGTAHLPKIVFITASGVMLFLVPSLGNLDTAFQGVNVWHCTQYLAITWYINRLRAEKGEMDRMPLIKRISGAGKAKAYYGFNMAFTLGTVLIIALTFFLLRDVAGGKWADSTYAFETAYYAGVLGFLWIHYYHDHFLFTKTETVLP